MNLSFDLSLIAQYKSPSQIARVLTEKWVYSNAYCPNCGNYYLKNYENNRPVADFFCGECNEQFELKSKGGCFGKKVIDGAYSTMIQRINSDSNPNFFFLSYNIRSKTVQDFIIIPKHFFVTRIIEARPPLKNTAKRAGWIGCNIVLSEIPSEGQLYIVKCKKEVDKSEVLKKWRSTEFLKSQSGESRGWLVDIMCCLDKMNREFILDDLYKFEEILKKKHPQNHHIKEKMRQQLQILRDKGLVEIVSKGKYRKTTM